VTAFIANARMYAATQEAEAAWRNLLARILEKADVSFAYEAYPAPQPLEKLWARRDLGCVFMCGFPIAVGLAEIVPIAAPVPAMSWAGGRAVYRSDLIVRVDSPFQTLADTFGHRLGWTVEHSHSGFNALRHHLLGFRTADRPNLFGEVKGHLVTARGILDAVKSGDIDVGPLDAYWHGLMRHHRPDLVEGIRVIDTTALAPIPAFVASPSVGPEAVGRMKEAFAAAATEPWFEPFRSALCLAGFEPVEQGDYAATLDRDRRAKLAGYSVPA
jgi:ABC-type phosphate/phosphonate transport system substrate-binding protein